MSERLWEPALISRQHTANEQVRALSGLMIVATPIGNLCDITLRALSALKHADTILCEDTRITRKLLEAYALGHVPLQSFHKHNESQKTAWALEHLRKGWRLALVSDGGTPLVSDPGHALIAACRAEGVPVTHVPGPSAVITGFVLAGMQTPFLFFGFLSRNAGERSRALEELASRTETLIFFEAPHRIRDTLRALLNIFGDRNACLMRELTKLHEEVHFAPLSVLCEQNLRGEIVLAVAGATRSDMHADTSISSASLTALFKTLATSPLPRNALKEIAHACGVPFREFYQRLIDEKDISSNAT